MLPSLSGLSLNRCVPVGTSLFEMADRGKDAECGICHEALNVDSTAFPWTGLPGRTGPFLRTVCENDHVFHAGCIAQLGIANLEDPAGQKCPDCREPLKPVIMQLAVDVVAGEAAEAAAARAADPPLDVVRSGITQGAAPLVQLTELANQAATYLGVALNDLLDHLTSTEALNQSSQRYGNARARAVHTRWFLALRAFWLLVAAYESGAEAVGGTEAQFNTMMEAADVTGQDIIDNGTDLSVPPPARVLDWIETAMRMIWAAMRAGSALQARYRMRTEPPFMPSLQYLGFERFLSPAEAQALYQRQRSTLEEAREQMNRALDAQRRTPNNSFQDLYEALGPLIASEEDIHPTHDHERPPPTALRVQAALAYMQAAVAGLRTGYGGRVQRREAFKDLIEAHLQVRNPPDPGSRRATVEYLEELRAFIVRAIQDVYADDDLVYEGVLDEWGLFEAPGEPLEVRWMGPQGPPRPAPPRRQRSAASEARGQPPAAVARSGPPPDDSSDDGLSL